MAIVSIADLSKWENERLIVDNISFTQAPGEKIAIAGETGSGKSSILKMIGGLMQPSTGEIRVDDRRVIGPLDQLMPGHPGVAYLGQHFELRNNYYVHEILDYANQLTPEEANKIYEICQIDHLMHRRSNIGLSGGERQRIALARLLTGKPKLLLLDEPFSNLDILHKQIIRNVVQDISATLACNIIMVSHDPLDILSWSDTVIIMKEGKMLQKDSPIKVYQQPANAYCAGLLGDYNLVTINKKNYFSRFHKEASSGKQLLFRPESIMISDEDNNNLPAIIQSVLFFGSYYLLEVLAEDQLLRVRTTSDQFKIGDIVYLTIPAEDICWV